MHESPKTILTVNTNINLHEQEAEEWGNYNIGVVRSETMQNAICRITRNEGKEEFLLILIYEESVPDYAQYLCIMRDLTRTPIFVIAADYSLENRINIMNLGVDAYYPFNPCVKENVLFALALLKTKKRWIQYPDKPLPVLAYGKIILLPSQRIVFVDNIELPLVKKEFEVLQYLMQNSGRIVTHTQMLKNIWGDGYNDNDADVLWRTVSRLRKKLSKISPEHEYIRAEYGMGYKLLL